MLSKDSSGIKRPLLATAIAVVLLTSGIMASSRETGDPNVEKRSQGRELVFHRVSPVPPKPPTPLLTVSKDGHRSNGKQEGLLVHVNWQIDDQRQYLEPGARVEWPMPLVGTKSAIGHIVIEDASAPEVATIQVYDEIGEDGIPPGEPILECNVITYDEVSGGCTIAVTDSKWELMLPLLPSTQHCYITLWAAWLVPQVRPSASDHETYSAAWIFHVMTSQ